MISNLTIFDSSVLGISIVAGSESDPNDLNITSWNVTSNPFSTFNLIFHRNGLEKYPDKALISIYPQGFYQRSNE